MDWSLFDRYRNFIPDFEGFLKSLEEPFPTGLRGTGDLGPWLESVSDHAYKKPFEELFYYEVEGERKFWGGRLEHHHGHYFMQAFSSLLSVLALSPGENETILDMCAAPGGKTTHLAQMMKNTGLLIALEPDLNRRRVLKANLNRMLVANCMVYASKGQDISLGSLRFDRILLDGHCSSEGTFRHDTLLGKKRRKVNYLSYNKEFREKLHREQAALLDHSVSLLKENGILVYSTCTYDPDENEGAISKLLKRHPNLVIEEIPFSQEIEDKLSQGIGEYEGQGFGADLLKTRRVYPHKLNSIGFYVARIRKLSS
ncbi:MAG: hypothetical protein ACN6I0_00155 [Peredibacter sp.]